MSRIARLIVHLGGALAACACLACAPPAITEGESEGEGGTEGEGEGNVVATAVLMRDVAGARTEEPFDLRGALPIAAGEISGAPTVIAEELADGAFTGALLVFVPPFADPRPLRIANAFPAAEGTLTAATAIGDLDASGRDDVVMRLDTGRTLVLADDGDGLFEVDQPWLEGRGSIAVVRAPDRTAAALLAGSNGDSLTLTLRAGAVHFQKHSGRHRVGDFGYCLAAFAAHQTEATSALYGVGEVCASFDINAPAPPRGPDRLFALDADVLPTASVDLDTEGTRVVFPFGDGLLASGFGFVSSVDESGPARAVLAHLPLPGSVDVAAERAAVGTVRITADAAPALLLVGPPGAVAPPGSVLVVNTGDTAGVFPLDVDGDGVDELLVVRVAR